MPPKKKKGNVGKGKKKVTKKNNVSDEEIDEEPASQEQSLYDILEKRNFSKTLFMKEGEPMVFYIAPCEQKKQISNLIVKGGGLVQRFAKEGVVTLVETKSDLPEKIPKECYSINYITDSIQANKRVDQARYRVKLNKKAAKRDSFSPRKRILFTKEDDEKLVEFVNKHGEYTPSGSRLWQLAEKKLQGGHTWQSMRSRYLKVVCRKLDSNSDDDGEDAEEEEDQIEEDQDQNHSDHSQSKKKRKSDHRDDNGHVKKKSKKNETDEEESSDDLKESPKKSNLQSEESFIEPEYLDNMQNNDDEDEEEEMDENILTQEVSKPRTTIHSKNDKKKNNNKKNENDENNDNNDDNDNNEEDNRLQDKSYVKEIVLSVINNLMLTTKLPRSVVVHGLIVNNGVVSDTIQYLHNPQEFYDSRSKSAQIWTYTEDKILLDKHERGLEDLANARGAKSIQYRQLFLES